MQCRAYACGADPIARTSELNRLMASQTARPCIVWFRDDLRLSDHPALHAAAKTGAPVICLYVFDEQHSAGCAAARRRGALVAGAIAARLAEEPCGDRLAAGAAQGTGGRRSSPNWRARPTPARCSGTRSRRRRIRPWPIRSPPRWTTIGVAAQSFPGDLLAAPANIRNKEGRGLRVFTPFWRRVQSSGRSAKAAAGAEDAKSRTGHCQRTAGELASRTRRIRTGPADCARPGRRAKRPRRRGSGNSSKAAWPAIPPSATGPTARAPQACRRICASARSARGRSGTPRALPPPSIQSLPATSTNSSANWAGASSAGICCSTCPISPSATCSPHSTPFRGRPTPRRCAPGSAAGPAIPSSMPACANSGTPA